MFQEHKTGGQKTYRRIGVGFVIFSVFLLAVVMYMALSRATIVVEPEEETINADLLVTIKEGDLRESDILGKVEQASVVREAVFSSSGEGKEVPGVAEGEITIYNKSGKNQPLIKTTRFLAEDGTLFRLKEGVTVYAGSSAKAVVYADEEGATGNVSAGKFTIPGLSASLQKMIYGESDKDMTGGTKKVSVITREDIDNASKSLRDSLVLEATEKLKKELNKNASWDGIAYKDELVLREVSVEEGEKAESFEIRMELKVTGVAFSDKLRDQATKTLANMIPSDKKITSSNIGSLDPIIEQYDVEGGSASIKVALSGNTIINDTSSIFDRDKLAGLTQEEVEKYLRKYTGIKKVEIKFFPFWMEKVPKLRDHIRVVVR